MKIEHYRLLSGSGHAPPRVCGMPQFSLQHLGSRLSMGLNFPTMLALADVVCEEIKQIHDP